MLISLSSSSLLILVTIFSVNNKFALSCAPKANASNPIDESLLRKGTIPPSHSEIIILTHQPFNPENSQIVIKFLLYKVNKYAQTIGNIIPTEGHHEESIDFGGRLAIRVLVEDKLRSCDQLDKMTTETDVEIIRTCLLFFGIIGIFGNVNIILATLKNNYLQHKCGILLIILATCDTICLLNELQSFVRMTLKIGGTTLRRCFWANISYIFIEPMEVYMILSLAFDRLIALNFIVFYRTINKTKYVIAMTFPGILIGFFFLISSILGLSDDSVDPCILPMAMPENIGFYWNQWNLWGSVLTLLIYIYTYIAVYCCAFKNKNEKNVLIQKMIMNTVVIGAAVFSISSVLSAVLIAVFSHLKNPPINPDTISTYAVIPGLISYSCNFYVYYWRSSDYRKAFVGQLCCGKRVDESKIDETMMVQANRTDALTKN